MSPGPSSNVRACGRVKLSGGETVTPKSDPCGKKTLVGSNPTLTTNLKQREHGNTANYLIDPIRDPTIDHSIHARQRTYRYA